jgi:transcriptional repressor NrdR
MVIKRDGRREEFDRDKLLHAIRAACHKRPVDLEQITMIVDDVIDALEAQYEREIPSHAIGEEVMRHLRRIDQVAYVRFASVYKEFRDVSDIMEEISNLGKPKK